MGFCTDTESPQDQELKIFDKKKFHIGTICLETELTDLFVPVVLSKQTTNVTQSSVYQVKELTMVEKARLFWAKN